MTGRPIVLYVANNVSLSSLHVASNVTPKILGLLTVAILMPSTIMLRSSLYTLVQFVNMVAIDLVGESEKRRRDISIMQSSAYEVIEIPSGG